MEFQIIPIEYYGASIYKISHLSYIWNQDKQWFEVGLWLGRNVPGVAVTAWSWELRSLRLVKLER